MALTGISPTDPIPGTRRELVFAAGAGGIGTPERRVLLVGNRTSGGSETVNVIGLAIVDDADARARFGLRSELYAMYRKYVAVDSDATIHAIAVPEAGTASAVDFTFATNASAVGSVEVSLHGEVFEVSVEVGETPTTVAANVVAAINSQDEGRLLVTANNVAGVVTITASQLGLRGDYITGGATATRGARMRMTRANAMTITKGNFVAGTGTDDITTAAAAAANDEFFYQALAMTTAPGAAIGPVYAISPSDNGVGEWSDMITTQALPVNGKEQTFHLGSVGTPTQAVALADGNGMNSAWGKVYAQENNDWPPSFLAAHHAAVKRSQEVSLPSANVTGYTSGDGRIYQVPTAFVVTDRPTTTELRQMLNSGVSPISFTPLGKAFLVRDITTRSTNASGQDDYRVRQGHIPSVVAFAWQTIKARWEANKQPFVADDPVQGQKPTPLTTTPGAVKAMIFNVYDELAGPNPLGLYPGPILAPDKLDAMKAALVVRKVTAGISVTADIFAVEHLLKGEFLIKEVGPGY